MTEQWQRAAWVKHGGGRVTYISPERAVEGKRLDDLFRSWDGKGQQYGDPRWDVATGWYYMADGDSLPYGPFASQAEAGPTGQQAA
jgi:hypothetical protein